MAWLNYHHLYYFWRIATEGSIAGAAKKLHIGQPTLSTQLRLLEEALGRPLFERRKKQLVLTEAGRIALNYANEIFRMGGEMQEAIQDRLPASRLHVQIGCLDSVPKQLIVKLTQEAYRLGNCAVSILEGKGDELIRELLSHRLDLILSNYPPPMSEEIRVHARRIARLPVTVCGARKFSRLKKGFPESLSGQPFVLPTSHSKLRHDLEHFFRSHSIAIDPVAETQDTAVQKLLGTAGVGLVALTSPAVTELIKRGELAPLGTLRGVFEEVWLLSATRKIENPIASTLMKKFEIKAGASFA